MSKELTKIINEHLWKQIQNNALQNDEVVEIIDSLGSSLNAQTISYYAKGQSITYNGVLDRIKSGKLKTFELFGVRFVIDNY